MTTLRAGLLLALALATWAPAVRAGGFGGAHMDRARVPWRCGGCHGGHGVPGTPQLRVASDALCLRCHGTAASRAREVSAGHLAAGARPASVEPDFRKPYRHPIERSSLHRADEETGPRSGAVPRHAACVDCHGHHDTPPGEPRSLLGLRPRRSPLPGLQSEADLCLRCHGPTPNRPSYSDDIGAAVGLEATSSHAILAPGQPRRVPSLIAPWTPTSILSCSDCHGSDDPDGPRGPHGSAFRGLLRERYDVEDDRAETQDRYALCYRCHSRKILLADESFRHSLHLQGRGASRGTPCSTCHDAHGSTRYPGLVVLDTRIVRPDRFGRLEYDATTGRCYLTCHEVEHPAGPLRNLRVPMPRLPIAPGLPVPRAPAPRR